jgi:hypothetical protein
VKFLVGSLKTVLAADGGRKSLLITAISLIEKWPELVNECKRDLSLVINQVDASWAHFVNPGFV